MGDEIYKQDDAFWEGYHKGRARVPPSFFERLYSYHSSHGGAFDVVHDIGAGSGQFSLELAKRFKHVIVTEPTDTNIDVARAYLTRHDDPSKYTFVKAKGEDDVQPSASVDVAFICNAMHWMDPEPTVETVAKQLKPGGTLLIALFGISSLLDNDEAHRIWTRLFDKGIASVFDGAHYTPDERTRTGRELQDSGYDALPLPEKYFEPGVQRLKLNVENIEDPFYLSKALKDQCPLVSRLGPHDQVLSEKDDDSWFFEYDTEGLKTIFKTYPFPLDPAVLEPDWQELEKLLGGKTIRGVWPASIIMATRK